MRMSETTTTHWIPAPVKQETPQVVDVDEAIIKRQYSTSSIDDFICISD